MLTCDQYPTPFWFPLPPPQMKSIKPLPETVQSSVRSGIILFDLTRVVEELIFNSLDAGATKVSVAVGIGTCYVKVVDNGSGITRDGLILLGDKYATSKFDQSTDMDTATGSFGFRGEALGSISDVSLLEVVTKAHGRPNGYRKVMKGCKCLYLGIDDDRQCVGTTVIVRDLFYNQPVRRKHLQSSPKKVLHSVKECVLRIALIHLKASFKVVDIESEDELLCTYPSSTPLPLLMSGFGIEVSSYLREMDVSDKVLKLCGYMSGPCETFSVKAFQYVYINSRFICKGPIHKLLNQLAARFNCPDLSKANIGSQKGKRSRSQTCPTYILNLSCPRSHYDLTFEPSKTSAEFTDWDPVLTFIEKAITHFWGQNISYGDFLSHGADRPGKDDLWKEDNNIVSTEEDYGLVRKRCRTQCCQVSLDIPSPQSKLLAEESKHMSVSRENIFSCRTSHRNALEFEENQTEMGFSCQTDHSFQFQPFDGYLTQSRETVSQVNSDHLGTPDTNVSSAEDYFLEKKFATERSSENMDCILGSRWEDMSLKVDANISDGLSASALSADCFEIGNDVEEISEDVNISFLRSCSSRTQRSLLPERAFFANDEKIEFRIGLGTKKKWLDCDYRVDFEPWQDEARSVWPSPKLITRGDMCTVSDIPARHSIKSLSIAGECFTEDIDLPPDSVAEIRNFGSSHRSYNSDWSSLKPDPLFSAKLWGTQNFIDEYVLKGCFKYDRSARYDYSSDREGKDCISSFDTMQNSSNQENCSFSSSMNVSSGLKVYGSVKGDICKSRGQNLDDVLFPKHNDTFFDETEWLLPDSCGKDHANTSAAPLDHISSLISIDEDNNRRAQIRYQEKAHGCEKRPRRSHSAPPFYRGKKKFLALNNCSTIEAGIFHFDTIKDAASLQETNELEHQKQSSDVYHPSSKPSSVNHSLCHASPDMKTIHTKIQNREMQTEGQCLHTYNMNSEDFTAKETQDPSASVLKWRNSCPHTASGEKSDNLQSRDTSILDISSGILHLAGDSLVPKSIDKNCLEGAKVLQQVDRKFIPVVAGRTLAIIDQHAADERIRLEELRQKVLSGEMKTITYLDAEQELVLPEIGYQLLHNYAEQIQNWGWICNIHAESSRNLNLLHRQPSFATLLAVPCILGVNLTDADLLEFLQQLADTDGSSVIPPSVLRVLNFKACRGAIMFGDKLLPSECSLIVEELKQTSLCFQCAHGRPTTAPLVNLEMLHKQIAKLGLWSGGSNELWHGLRRHEVSLERAAQRLGSAGGQC